MHLNADRRSRRRRGGGRPGRDNRVANRPTATSSAVSTSRIYRHVRALERSLATGRREQARTRQQLHEPASSSRAFPRPLRADLRRRRWRPVEPRRLPLNMRKTLIALLTAASARPPRLLADGPHHFAVRPAVISYTGEGTAFLGGADAGTYDWGHLRRRFWTPLPGLRERGRLDRRLRSGLRRRTFLCAPRPGPRDARAPREVHAAHGPARWGSGLDTDRLVLRGIGRGRWIWDFPL
jgi:hypothetical protein